MGRYFLEVGYKGTRFSGFQVQENAVTVQSEMEQAFATLQRQPVHLTGSSRTDAGVHALQNFFHFDFEAPIHPQFVYKMNAILPQDIVVRNIVAMPAEAHSRFDATSREYLYRFHRFKNPFLQPVSLYYPYTLDMPLVRKAADFIKEQTNFYAFAKTNSQVKTFNCNITRAEWQEQGEEFAFNIEGNRFLRGMVRLLTATLLRLGRHKLSWDEFVELFEQPRKCGFSVPAHALFLVRVNFAENYFPVQA
jgi:tRNA pseudouridine38-40 synthase